jgi:hypothetical protein
MSFEFYAQAKYQFGRDVIQNVGPYGYLQYPAVYSGILPNEKLGFGILFGLVLGWFVLEGRRFFPTTAGKVTWFLAIFFSMGLPGEELDPVSDLLILLAGHQLLMSDRTGAFRYIQDAVLCVFLGLLLLLKSTNLLLIGLLMMLVVFERVRTRRFPELAWNLGWVSVSAFGLWVRAGQKISNAAAFFRGAMEFSKGYNEAMWMRGKPELAWLALTVLGLFALVNLLRVWQFRLYWHRLPTSVFEAACLFVSWKHGYVRTDHAALFWSFIIPAAPLLFLAQEPPPAPARPRNPAHGASADSRPAFSFYRVAAVSVAVTILCTIWAACLEKDQPAYRAYASIWAAVESPLSRMYEHVRELADWPGQLRLLRSELAANRSDAALPEVRHVVGDATIDDFGFYPGLMLLNDFHYTPRPMPINFAATTEMLMRRNAEFYQNDASGPSYLLADIAQFDGRLPPQDDALALPEVLTRYQPVLVEHGHILLKRVPGRPLLERVPLESRSVAWGQAVPLPKTNARTLWCAIDIQYSLLGRVRSFLFRPAPVYMVFESPDMQLGPVRMLASGARTGFLLRPLIMNAADFLAVYGTNRPASSGPAPDFDTIRLVTEDQYRDCFQPAIKLAFSTIKSKK